ncbi:hypothetical protein SAMN05421771_2043 [Granulicella pectinivorans]|jgi:hypothetical protein|uniref:OsmC-like protein n=1 Tax=Granulicella pectinivorans TaxID=474950 RepID=A0A1I6M8J0_9BACT|nr:hypothetical protein SAMN05421771_2043 [Granulicella pectinivorans]
MRAFSLCAISQTLISSEVPVRIIEELEVINIQRHQCVQYTAKIQASEGRDGSAHSIDKHLAIRLTVPGTIGTGTNPERLLTAGWSACLLSGCGV